MNCEVVGFKDKEVILMVLGELILIVFGCKVIFKGIFLSVMCSDNLLGKVFDGFGNFIDNLDVVLGDRYNLNNEFFDLMKRKKIWNIMEIGVRVIDVFIICGEG